MGLGNGMANNRGVVPARRVGLVLATAIMPALAAAAPAHAMPVWNPAAFVSPAGSSAASPQIALDAQGNAIAVWVVSGTNNEVVYSDHPAGGSWTAPVALSDPAEGAGAPVVAVDAHADAFVAWSQGNNNNIRIRASYRPAGGSWQATPDVLSAANVVSVSPRLTVDGGGDEAIGWVQNDSGFTYTTMYGDYRAAGGAWKIPKALSQTTTSQLVEQPAGTFDPQGNATFVWVYEATGSHAVIETSTYIKSPGLWSLFPGVLSNASHDSIGPQIASDHAGDLSAVWQESTTGPAERNGVEARTSRRDRDRPERGLPGGRVRSGRRHRSRPGGSSTIPGPRRSRPRRARPASPAGQRTATTSPAICTTPRARRSRSVPTAT